MITCLIAPEILSDLGSQPYLRDATPTESEIFRQDHSSLNWSDDCGRPYFAVVIDTDHPDCPPQLVSKAKSRLRIRWL